MPEGAAGTRALVVGLGPMGRGIARVFAAAGADVTVVDATPELTETNFTRLKEEAAADAERGKLGDSERLERIAPGDSLAAALADCEIVIEAILESMEAKSSFLAEVEQHAPADAIVASNTSSLSIAAMAEELSHPGRMVGMHFFNPPRRMRLVEVIVGPKTDEATADRARELVLAMGKTPVICADSPNFIVNRVCRPLYYEAQLLRSTGTPAAVVDIVARRALGHRMGPLELLDFTGLHTHLGSSETALREFGDPRYRPIPPIRQLVRAGLKGKAAGQGFYEYSGSTPREQGDFLVREPDTGGSAEVELITIPGRADDSDVERVHSAAAGGPTVVDSSDGRWLRDLPPGAGWIRLHGSEETRFAEVVKDPLAGITPPPQVAALLDSLGASSVEVPATPGLVADRLQAAMTNEGVTVAEEGTATEEDVDTALRLGMNHPLGPWQVLRAKGATAILGQLEALLSCTGDPRYRPALLLQRLAAGEQRSADGA